MMPGVPPRCRGLREGTAGPTSCTRGRLAREGSASPLRHGGYTLHIVYLFRLSPKVAKNRKMPFMLKNLQEDDKAQPCRSIFVADPLLLLRQDRPLFG